MSPTATGTYQRGRARSTISQASSTGTDVPKWSGELSRAYVPASSCGAIIIPAAMTARATASRPVVLPMASRATSSIASVYVRAAAMCTASALSPCTSSTSMYSGTSVV